MRMCVVCEGFGLKTGQDGFFRRCPTCKGAGFCADVQSRKMSVVEVVTSTALGFVVAVITTVIVFPWFGLRVTLPDNLAITAIFTVVSLVRGYCVRRLFEACR